MAKKRRHRPQPMAETALRGGAVGVLAGLAISVAERELLSRVAGGDPHRAAWDDLAARGLSRVGVDVGDRGRIATGMLTQALYAGVLGATYAVVRERTKDSRAGRILLEGVLTYAASFVFPDEPKPPRRGRRLALKRKLVKPANPAAVFSRVTTMALGALTR